MDDRANAAYAHLLETGWTEDRTLMTGDIQHTEHCEPWYEAIEALAAADGLVVLRSNSWPGAMSYIAPAMEIGRPDGGDYGFEAGSASDDKWRNVILPAIEYDWGDLLKTLRARYRT